jgi:hypothetical protein
MFPSDRNPADHTEPLDPPQRQIQIQANQLVAHGKPGQAAHLFAQLAEVESAGHPQRAANLHAQAALAFADDQQGPAALIQARAALHLFLKEKMLQRAPEFYASITRKLNDKGMHAIAGTLTGEFGAKIAALPAAEPAPGQKHGLLPTNCPQCGAPIHTDRARWVDAMTAECEYCGSQIRPE